ncbi:MAG: N-6 DNA methylase [Planctomycetaceae bacterium]|nr:N-6 DNA methylase [Planctomycetaceae bacterium]
MQNEIAEYIADLNNQLVTESAGEHTHRPALQRLLTAMLPHLIVSNEPARLPGGNIDFALFRKKDTHPIAFVETKNLNDSDLPGENKNKEQFDRYKRFLDHIIFTDYLEFLWYDKEQGGIIDSVRIAEVKSGKIVLLKENVEKFKSLIERFGQVQPQTIDSSAKLAEVMAGKARVMAEVIERMLEKENAVLTTDGDLLAKLMADFKEILIPDITATQFADVYAQTIVYGMFAARRYCADPKKFTREMVAKLIPKSNPLLHELFDYIARRNLDEDVRWIVDDLVEAYRVTDMDAVMINFGEHTLHSNPIIHFYENFLTKYNPVERKNRGVWYTPPAIVHFIVRAVDEILQRDFNLPNGLADSSKTGKAHKVQILDPTVGTGAFLVETINQIYHSKRVPLGVWNSYVKEHLIPRLNGFEVLMAPYAIAHINFTRCLEQTGYQAVDDQRFRIFLTNSLKGASEDTQRRLSFFLDQEADAADHVKGKLPIMVVMGNPPYRGITANKGLGDIDVYKYVDGVHIKERNSKWLNDDYVKFIRLGQMLVDKNREGVLAFITNHNYIDNPTFRGMRWNLMRSFDRIYIIDLHGNSKKKETTPNGDKDVNVFDIQQGVSINIFIKTGRKTENALAEIYHYDLYGKRQDKFAFLRNTRLIKVPFVPVKPTAPFYFLKPRCESNLTEYEQGFKINELMPVNTTGIVSMGDSFAFANSKEELEKRLQVFLKRDYTRDQLDSEFSLGKNYAEFVLQSKKTLGLDANTFVEVDYRPFEKKWTYFDNRIVFRPRTKVMQHFLKGENIGLVTCRQGATNSWNLVNITRSVVDDSFVSNRTKERGYAFPLYLYPETDALIDDEQRKPNLDETIVGKIAQVLKLKFEAEKSSDAKKFAPIDLLDYIYAVLHSPAYRERYQEFLKVDFPRVPYPEDAKQFRKLVKWGERLRRLHLMEGVIPQQGLADYDVSGNNVVEKLEYKNGKAWINATQFFDNVPSDVWNFYTGGYQPAQKWLKDRKGRTLDFDDIVHYQKIIRVLKETIEVMNEVDISLI